MLGRISVLGSIAALALGSALTLTQPAAGKWLRAGRVSRTGRCVPPVRIRTVSRRISRALSQCLSLERLPCRLLARAVGTLPGYGLSRASAQRLLEILTHPSYRAGQLSECRPHGVTAQE